jgi:hypothetical protein
MSSSGESLDDKIHELKRGLVTAKKDLETVEGFG